MGFKAFGLALDGTRLRVILGTEVRVDLNQSQRWMTAFLDLPRPRTTGIMAA